MKLTFLETHVLY
jgi:hypothetical protein